MKKTFFFIFSLLSILLFFYTFYKSEIYWNGDKRDYYFIYYIASVLIFLFSIIALFLSEKIKIYLMIILASSVFTVYIFETYLTLKYEDGNGSLKITGNIYKSLEDRKKLYKKQTGNDYDTRTKFEIYNKKIKKDKNIKVIVHPSNYIFDSFNLNLKEKIFPLSGISNSKTIFCEEMGYYSFYESDRYGFNNPDPEWDKKNIKYLLVGDSFTHGACVNRPNDIASVLRQLSEKSVLNIGYSGNGPLLEFATLREYIRPNIENIIWLYYEGNDMKNFDAELKSKLLLNYINDPNFTQNLKNKQDETNKLAQLIIKNTLKIEKSKKKEKQKIDKLNLIKHIKLSNFRTVINGYLPKNNQPQSPSQPKFKELLKLSKKIAKKNNSNFYFVYLPSYSRYKINYDNSAYEQVKKIIKELDINFIDVHQDIFELEANPFKFFPFDSSKHYNIEGYKKISTLIEKIVSNN